MKNINYILLLFSITFFSCKKKDNYIFHVTVDDNNTYNYNNIYQDSYIDIDRNSVLDMLINTTVDENTIYIDSLNQYINNNINTFIVSQNQSSGLEVAAIEDCLTFLTIDEEINPNNFNWENTATIATNNPISNCNITQNLKSPYFAFRIKNEDSFKYGWMRVTYNLLNTTYQVNEWAVNLSDDEKIKTGQTEN